MAGNTRYHRLPEDSRLSMESETGNAEHDATLLLLEPSDDGNSSPKKESKFTFHPTMIFRLITICLLIPSFVLFILSHRPRSTSAIVFVTLAIVRNILVILHHVISRHIRFKIEFRNGSSRFPRPRRSCPTWMKQGPLHLLLDLVHVVLLLITSIIATQGSYGWYRSSRLTVPACILAHIGNLFYLISIIDMGKPSNITITGDASFNYNGIKNDPQPEPLYQDIEAVAGPSVLNQKTGSD